MTIFLEKYLWFSMLLKKSLFLKSGRAAAGMVFTCNICGTECRAKTEELDREKPSCEVCGSNIRMRAIVHLLSMEFCGKSLVLGAFDRRPAIKGLGMSDWYGYAEQLKRKFSYTNTFFHKSPRFDIKSPPAGLEGSFDFVISSDVFEHVPPPVSMAFLNARKLLKRGGIFIFTAPYAPGGVTVEHFAGLHEYRVEKRRGKHVLVNKTPEGRKTVYDDLVFHGGPGSTLEFRVFAEGSIAGEFRRAGFSSFRICNEAAPEYGIFWKDNFSLPWIARA